MNYLWIIIIIIGKMLTCVLRHVRVIFYSNEEEIRPQMKYPTSNHLLKDPLLKHIYIRNIYK